MILTYSCDENQIRDVYDKFPEKQEMKEFFISDATQDIILPCVVFKRINWKEDRNSVLFIAESPPWIAKNGTEINQKEDCKNKEYVYFYNKFCQNNSNGLANCIFSGLGIKEGSREKNLDKFSEKHFLLTDTIKCIIKKHLPNKKKIPKKMLTKLANYSAEKILMHEIDTINPQCIVVLGKTALESIKEISEKKNEGKNWRLTPAHGYLKNIKNFNEFKKPEQDQLFDKCDILVMPFPNTRNYNNKRYPNFKTLIDDGFKKFKG